MTKYKISDETIEKIKTEYEKCIGCKLCMKGSPMLNEYCDSPLDLLKDLIETKETSSEIPYSCALCGYCKRVCPKDVDLRDVFLSLRKDIVTQTDGRLPKELGYGAVKAHQRNSFSRVFSTDILHLDKYEDTVFFPGCSLMAYSPEIVRETFLFLREKMSGIGIYLSCCGKPTRCMGFEHTFKDYYGSLEKEFSEKKIKRVITACPNCFITIRDTSYDIEVVSLWEVISSLGVREDLVGIGRDIDITFTIHDPCPTRLESKTHDAVRDIIDQLGFKIEEMSYNREETLCCGSGGMLNLTNNTLALKQMKRRASETDNNFLITYCEECVWSMKRGGKSAVHLLDLLFNKDISESFNQRDSSTIRNWLNRLLGKTRIKKLRE